MVWSGLKLWIYQSRLDIMKKATEGWSVARGRQQCNTSSTVATTRLGAQHTAWLAALQPASRLAAQVAAQLAPQLAAQLDRT